MKISTSGLIAALIISLVAMCGCKEDQPAAPAPAMTVEWYKANEQARKDMLAKCNNNPGELAASPDCVNATVANEQLVWSAKKPNKGIQVKALTAKDMQ